MINRLKRRVGSLVRQTLVRLLPGMGEQIMQLATYYPHAQTTYSVPVYRDQVLQVGGEPLPIPPQHPFWANYCTSAKTWVQSGKDDLEIMRRILRESGFAIEEAGKILELGVAGGRLIRHLQNLTPKAEIWGVDLWASAIRWCQEHLSPPFYFATTTVVPHLPFSDQTFDLIYAGSVFTHLDDLVEAWFLELQRILNPGGRLYFTINDRHAVSRCTDDHYGPPGHLSCPMGRGLSEIADRPGLEMALGHARSLWPSDRCAPRTAIMGGFDICVSAVASRRRASRISAIMTNCLKCSESRTLNL
jgi:SAM-dependent methyltransferase